MKIIFYLLVSSLMFCLNVNAQYQNVYTSEQNFAFSQNFSKQYLKNNSGDSILFYFKKMTVDHLDKNILALNIEPMLVDIAVTISNEKSLMKGPRIQFLEKAYNDNDYYVSNLIAPFLYYVRIKEGLKNGQADSIAKYIKLIKAKVLETKSYYTFKNVSYGMTIANMLLKYPQYQQDGNFILNYLEKYFNESDKTINDSLNDSLKSIHSKNQYFYLAVHYLKAINDTDKIKQEAHFKILGDHLFIDAYRTTADLFSDEVILFGDTKTDFALDYLNFLRKEDRYNTPYSLDLLSRMAIDKPQFKEELKSLYNANKRDISFRDYWLQLVNKKAKDLPAPFPSFSPLDKQTIDEKHFSSNENIGKWVLWEFWGTWCGPCRRAHPELQKFYDSIMQPNNIVLLTFAVNDDTSKVRTYLQQNNYTFPVVMDDYANISRMYGVKGMPGIVLFTPQGKYFEILQTDRWMEDIKAYIDL